jgi:ADP-heptose:LPS heptosyltransferase
MRAVDFWVGVPLTFLLTVLRRIRRFFAPAAAPTSPPRNILFIQLAEMGTMVVAYPALRKARERFPDATLYVLCFEQIRASVEVLGIIPAEHIFTIDARSLVSLLRDTLTFARQARHRSIDTVINLEAFVRFSNVVSWLSGATRRVGFHRFNQEGLYTGDLVTHHVFYNAHVHAAHTFLDLVHALDAPPDQVPRVKRPRAGDCLEVPRIATDATAAARLWRELAALAPGIGPDRKLVVVNPNSSDHFPMRRLPLESFVETIDKLLNDPDVFVLVTGLAHEKPEAQYICERLGSPRVLDLTGRTTLLELLHLFDLAHVLVTNDSGPAHFAALTKIHVIVFFGPEIPERYRPLTTRSDVVHTGFTCSPCIGPHNQRQSPCTENLCLKSVDIHEVVALVRSRLEAAWVSTRKTDAEHAMSSRSDQNI